MSPKERYELIKLARESFVFGQKLLEQAGCKLVVNTASSDGEVVAVPDEVDFMDSAMGNAERKRYKDGKNSEDLLETAPSVICTTAHYGDGNSQAVDIPDWWAGVIEEKRHETAKLLGFEK